MYSLDDSQCQRCHLLLRPHQQSQRPSYSPFTYTAPPNVTFSPHLPLCHLDWPYKQSQGHSSILPFHLATSNTPPKYTFLHISLSATPTYFPGHTNNPKDHSSLLLLHLNTSDAPPDVSFAIF